MKPTSLIRCIGIMLLSAGVGSMFHAWWSTQEMLHRLGPSPDTFIRWYFLGEPVSGVDLSLHDTYYIVINPVWAWLSVAGCMVGAVMALRPRWVASMLVRRN